MRSEKSACVGSCSDKQFMSLSAEAVQGAALSLESVDHIHGGHGLALGVLGVGDGITDHVLEEDLEDATGLLVDEARDALHTSTSGKTADGGLGDSLDVVTQDLAMTLGASFSQSFTSFASARHDDFWEFVQKMCANIREIGSVEGRLLALSGYASNIYTKRSDWLKNK